jgi:phage baseplate assembly protein W
MNQDKKHNAFFGVGLQQPFKINPSTGKTGLVSGVENIEQSIRAILSTKPGERLYHKDFGIDLTALIFEPQNAATLKSVEEKIISGLMQFQTMIIVDSVSFELNAPEGLINVDVSFTIRTTNTRGNYVYPYYIKEANQY